MLMIGISLFLVGSALSGLSQEMWQLILFRGVQGLGAGALFPIALAVIGDLFTPAERGKYQGLFGAVFGISFLIGPGLGGFLTDNISWHWIFFVNIPIGIISLAVIWKLLPTIKRSNASKNLDYLGAVVFTIAIGFLLVGLTNKQSGDWGDALRSAGSSRIGLALSALFVLVESRAKEPIVPLDLWRNRTYVSSILSTFFVSFGFFGAIIFLPRWFQVVRHETATASGYLIFPMLIGLIGCSIVAGALVSKTGKYKAIVLAGLAAMAVGHHAHDPAPRRHRVPDAVPVDVRRGPRHRPDAVGIHDHRPERGAVREARRRDQQPDLLPPDRWVGRARHRRDPVRPVPHGPAPGPDRQGLQRHGGGGTGRREGRRSSSSRPRSTRRSRPARAST